MLVPVLMPVPVFMPVPSRRNRLPDGTTGKYPKDRPRSALVNVSCQIWPAFAPKTEPGQSAEPLADR